MDTEHLESLYPANSREKEISEIVDYIKEGNSCQLIAAPGVGRGNTLGFLAYNRNVRELHLGEEQSSYHFVMVNFSEVKNRPLKDILKFLFLELVSSLHERSMDEEFSFADATFKESLAYNDELVLSQGLKKTIDYLTLDKKKTIVLLFERFETYIPSLTDDFFSYMRSLRNRAKYKFSIVFSLPRPLEETVEPVILSEFYEFMAGHIVYLDLTDTPGITFRIEYLQKLTRKTLEKKTLDSLFALTAGHARLTRSGIEALLAKPGVSEVTSSVLFEQKTVLGALWDIWNFLTASEKDFMIDTIMGKESETLIFLEKIHLTENGNITIPLLEEFVKSYAMPTYKEQEKIFYDIETNTIKKGATVISEKLTAAEFRLLAFFLENQDKVVDRETIIQAVWKNQETTLGVTDQALDQLIFRLRKQIEPNPNQPLYIQTVKGRGLKFVNA